MQEKALYYTTQMKIPLLSVELLLPSTLPLYSDTGTPAQQRAFPHQPTETPPLEPASCHGAPL